MTVFCCLASLICSTEWTGIEITLFTQFGRWSFRISAGIPAIPTDIFVFLLWPPGKSRNSTCIRPWLLPSRSYPVHLPSYRSTLQSLVTHIVVKQPTKLLRPHKLFGGICYLYLESRIQLKRWIISTKATTRYILPDRSLKSCAFLYVRIGKSSYSMV